MPSNRKNPSTTSDRLKHGGRLQPSSTTLEALRSEMELKHSRLDAMKIAYFTRVPFGDTVPDEYALKRAADEFVRAHHGFQRLRYGRIRVRLSAADLLR